MTEADEEVIRVSGDENSVVIGFVSGVHQDEYTFYTVDNPEELFGDLWPTDLVNNPSDVGEILDEAGKEPDVVIKDVAAMI